MSDEAPQSALFRKMADRIDHNFTAVFAGASVIVPPPDGGDTVEMLILDASQSAAQFWGALATKCQIEIAKLGEAQRNTQAFGRR